MQSTMIDTQRVPNEREPYYIPIYSSSQSDPQQSFTQSTPQSSHALSKLAPAEGWLSLVLLAVALYSVVFSVIAANWVHYSPLLLWCPPLGLMVGLTIAKISRFPQGFLHLGACLVGHWFAVWLTCTLAFHISVWTLLAALRAMLTGGIAIGGPVSSEIIFFFYLTFLCFFLGYFGSWLVYHAHLPWLVGLVYCSIMLVNLNYVQSDKVYLIIILLGSLLLLIARIHLVAQIVEWKREGLYIDHPWTRDVTQRFMRIASVLMLLALLLGWILPIQAQSASGQTFWDTLNNAMNNIASGHVSLQDPASLISRYQTPTNFFSDQLTIAGSVHLPKGEVLSYTSSAGPRYLEGFTYNVFDGHTWTTSVTPADTSSYPRDSALPMDSPNSDMFKKVTTNVTVIQPPEGTKHYIFAPAQPLNFDVSTAVYSDGSAATAWTQQNPLTQGETYQTTSLVPPSDAQNLAGTPLPATNKVAWENDATYIQTSASYLSLPHDLSPNVLKTTMQWAQGATDAYSALKMLESHLSNPQDFTYSVDNTSIPGNVDVVDWLLQTRKGYCTYYASAMAMMGRQLGIPTRVVNGFSQGKFDAQHNVWSVAGDDAHSWVQAYFPTVGWVSFDPTPGYASNATPGAQATPTPATTQPTPMATAPVKQPTLPPATQHNGAHTPPPDQGTPPINQSVLMGIALGVLLLSLLFLLLSLVRHWWRGLYANNSVVTGMFWRFCRLASWIGLAPKEWQTPYEYSGMLSRHFPQQQQSLWHLTDLFVRERWGASAQVPHPYKEQEVEHLWPALRGAFLHLILRKVKK